MESANQLRKKTPLADDEDTNYYEIDNVRYGIRKEELTRFSLHLNTLDLTDTFKAELSSAINSISTDPKQFVEIFKKSQRDKNVKESRNKEFRRNSDDSLNLASIEQKLNDIVIALQEMPKVKPSPSKLLVVHEESELDKSTNSNYYLTPNNTPTRPICPTPPTPQLPGLLPKKPSFPKPPEREEHHINEQFYLIKCCCWICEYCVFIVGILNIFVWIYFVLVVYGLVDNILYNIIL